MTSASFNVARERSQHGQGASWAQAWNSAQQVALMHAAQRLFFAVTSHVTGPNVAVLGSTWCLQLATESETISEERRTATALILRVGLSMPCMMPEAPSLGPIFGLPSLLPLMLPPRPAASPRT